MLCSLKIKNPSCWVARRVYRIFKTYYYHATLPVEEYQSGLGYVE